jgi:hypothetical protein
MSAAFVPEPEFEADNLTKTGAMHLAARLDAYWHAQGHLHVRHTVHAAHTPGNNRCAIWVVRSNLIRGQPPRRS